MLIDKEIEIDSSDFKTNDLTQELEDRIESKYIICTVEYQKEKAPQIAEMLRKLQEIHLWLNS